MYKKDFLHFNDFDEIKHTYFDECDDDKRNEEE